MKKYIILIIAALTVLAFYAFLIQTDTLEVVPELPEESTANVWSGTVLSVDLTGVMVDGPALIMAENDQAEEFTVAVPSMGIQLCGAAANIADPYAIAVGDRIEVFGSLEEEGRIVPCNDEDHYLIVDGTYSDSTYEYEFQYKKGPDGYLAIADTGSTHEDFLSGIQLFNKAEYEELERSTDPREGPPSILVRVYQNALGKTAADWSSENSLETNSTLARAEAEAAVIDGVSDTVHFVADGLYLIDTYVVARGEYIYVLMGAYSDVTSDHYEEYQSLLSSFKFTAAETAAPSGKIDVRAVCEGALAYMSFPDGEAASAFVEACVRGEHPEVIERYLEDRGLDGAMI